MKKTKPKIEAGTMPSFDLDDEFERVEVDADQIVEMFHHQTTMYANMWLNSNQALSESRNVMADLMQALEFIASQNCSEKSQVKKMITDIRKTARDALTKARQKLP